MIVKIIDSVGIPAVHVCTVTPISESVGVNRIVPAFAIPHPLGKIDVDPETERNMRKEKVLIALKALSTTIEDQQVFDEM